MELKKLSRVATSLLVGAVALIQPLSAQALAAEEYNLNNSVNAYYTSDNARESRNARSVYSAGKYYIYKEFNGMLNISRMATSPGGWINPVDNKPIVEKIKPEPKETVVVEVKETPENPKKEVGTVVLDKNIFNIKVKTYGYMNAYDAKDAKNSVSVVFPGEYYIYKTFNGMINVSRSKGSPGSWINPNTKEIVKPVIPQTKSDPVVEKKPVETKTTSSPKLYSLNKFKWLGVIRWGGFKYTWYSQRVLPGPGLRIPGRHVNTDGYVSDKDGYIVLANNAPMGTVFPTPFGYLGKVYDRGVYGNHLDVYVD